MTRTVIHLVDDASPGGVMRMLDHVLATPALNRHHRHEIRRVRRGSLGAPRLEAGVIVSHLAVTWASLPMLTALRALNPEAAIVHVEHSYTEAFVAGHAVPRRRFGTLMRVAYALFDRVVAVSAPQAAWLLRRGFAPAGRVTTIRPAVDLGPFLALEPRLEAAPRVCGLIGRLDAQKGFDIAIPAFRAAARPGDSLLVFGEGPERARLERCAAGDARIVFRGWAPRPAEAMAACDAVLMPSRWEAFGLVALEAQAAGRLLVVSTPDGMAEHALNGAIAVGANTADAWSDAIARLSRGGHAERILQGRLAARAAATRFDGAWLDLLSAPGAPAEAARAA